MRQQQKIKVKVGDKTFMLDKDTTISDFLKSQHLDPLKLIVLKKVGDSLVMNT